jgi:hypothetical protein
LTRTLVLVLLVAAVGTVVSSLALGGKVKLSVAQAHGKIGSVTPTRIKVGPVVCSIRHRTPAVGRFAVGDLVTVVCRNGILTSVKLAVAAAKAAQSQTGQAQPTQSVTQQGRPGQSQSVTSSTRPARRPRAHVVELVEQRLVGRDEFLDRRAGERHRPAPTARRLPGRRTRATITLQPVLDQSAR